MSIWLLIGFGLLFLLVLFCLFIASYYAANVFKKDIDYVVAWENVETGESGRGDKIMTLGEASLNARLLNERTTDMIHWATRARGHENEK